jgi:hypothetical protein
MPSPALPSGWLDTGITATFVFDYDAQFRAQVPSGQLAFLPPSVQVQTVASGAPLGNSGLGAGIESYATVDVQMIYTPGGLPTTVLLASGAGTASGSPALLGAVHVTRTIGPLRLGVGIDVDNVQRLEWFQDPGTTISTAISGPLSAPVTVESYAAGGPISIGWLPFRSYGLSDSPAIGAGVVSTYTAVSFATAQVGGMTIDAGPYGANAQGTAAGGVPQVIFQRWFGPPTKHDVNLVTIDETGTGIATDALYRAASYSTPATPSFNVANFGPGSPSSVAPLCGAAVLTNPWLAAQTVQPLLAEQTFVHEGNDPLNPGAAFTSWNVGTLTISSPVNVLRSSNAWAVDVGSATVGGTATVPTFNVTSAPVIVRRELASSWRHWNDPLHADYQSGDNYHATRHDAYASGASDDAWGAGLYAYLDVDLTVPAACDLAVELTWAILSDEAIAAIAPGSDETRALDGAATILTEVRTHSPVHFPNGRTTQRVDLCFPVEIGRPFHGERLDRFRLIGLQLGNHTLHSLNLVTSQNAYVQINDVTLDLSTAGAVMGGLTIAQDGQMAHAHWGRDWRSTGDLDGDLNPDLRKDHQNGLFGYAATVVGTLVGNSYGGAIGQRRAIATMADLFTEANRMEGLAAVYSDTVIAAAFTDAQGNTWTQRPYRYFLPNQPGQRIAAGSALNVAARLVVADVALPAGLSAGQLVCHQRNRLGGVVEALAVDASAQRAAAGATVTVRASTGAAPAAGDVSVGSGTTDASGYAAIPVRTGTLGGVLFRHYLEG